METHTFVAVSRTSLGIREMLFEELDALRNGKSSPQRANALAKISSQILSTVKTELEYASFLRSSGGSIDHVESLKLG
jgi:hypothetical protein